MRTPFAIALIISLIGGAYVWYPLLKNPCDIPIPYRIGTIDERFGTSHDEVRVVAYAAERLWEDAVSADLLTYDENARMTINFIFDERQQNANEALQLETVLTETKDLNDSLRTQYERLLSEYEALKVRYEERAGAYETRLTAYNDEVALWNERGGAPEQVFEELKEEKRVLDREQQTLNGFVRDLNDLVREMNALSARGNHLVEEYNEVAETYHDRFGDGDTFTQGDYKNRTINVYQFNDEAQLTLVLAHEFGHALTLGHVEGEASVMYETMKQQSLESGLSESDVAAYRAACTPRDIPYVPFL